MEIKQLKYFLTACEHSNFTRTAESLDIAVPTLTRSIAKLEDELGGQLFRRERHRIHLTDLGHKMRQHLGNAYASLQLAIREADQFTHANTTLRIGVISSFSALHLVAYLKSLRKQYSDLNLEILQNCSAGIQQSLEAGKIDLAITSQAEYGDNLRPTKLYDEPYLVAFPAGHRFESLNAVPLNYIFDEDRIKRNHCEVSTDFSKRMAQLSTEAPQERYATEREDLAQMMVLEGLGVALMPQSLPILKGLKTRPIDESELSRTVCIVTHAGRKHTKPVAYALRCAKSLDWNSVSTSPN